mmetsp:Transcript_5032/g.14275  ORF Transcript_5032/g.14275 Transcript_5032/m.14275 type:complete len:220 (-) Transcript_5032:420-1079(-)
MRSELGTQCRVLQVREPDTHLAILRGAREDPAIPDEAAHGHRLCVPLQGVVREVETKSLLAALLRRGRAGIDVAEVPESHRVVFASGGDELLVGWTHSATIDLPHVAHQPTVQLAVLNIPNGQGALAANRDEHLALRRREAEVVHTLLVGLPIHERPPRDLRPLLLLRQELLHLAVIVVGRLRGIRDAVRSLHRLHRIPDQDPGVRAPCGEARAIWRPS